MKNLISCPNCKTDGKPNVLCEIKDDGDIVVRRFTTRETRFKGNDFSIICDSCGEEVFYRSSK